MCVWNYICVYGVCDWQSYWGKARWRPVVNLLLPFFAHSSLPATTCHAWQHTQRRRREREAGEWGLKRKRDKKTLKDEIKEKKMSWQLVRRYCLMGKCICEREALITGGHEKGGELVNRQSSDGWETAGK